MLPLMAVVMVFGQWSADPGHGYIKQLTSGCCAAHASKLLHCIGGCVPPVVTRGQHSCWASLSFSIWASVAGALSIFLRRQPAPAHANVSCGVLAGAQYRYIFQQHARCMCWLSSSSPYASVLDEQQALIAFGVTAEPRSP